MMMDKKKLGFLILVCIVLISFIGCSNAEKVDKPEVNSQPEINENQKEVLKDTYIFGSGGMGSFYYTSLEAMSSVLNEKLEDFKTSSMSTNGGTENVVLLFDDKIDFAAMSGTEFVKAYAGEKPFKEKYEPSQVITFGLAQQLIAVKDNSGINSIYDLKGKKIAIGPNGSSVATIIKTYFELAGIEFEPVYLSHEEGKDAFIGGMVDAVTLLFMNNQPYPTTMQAEAAGKMKYLEWDTEINQKLMDKGLGFVLGTLPKETSKYLTKDNDVFCSTVILGARADASEEAIYQLVKTLVENTDALAKINGQLAFVKGDSIDDGFSNQFYVHKGTAKYLKEIGKWNDNFKIQ